MVKSNGKRDTGALEAKVIAVLMADKRLWKDLVVARLRATKRVCVSVNGKIRDSPRRRDPS